MKSKRHTPEQVITKLAEGDKMLHEGKTVAEVAQSFGITETTWYRVPSGEVVSCPPRDPPSILRRQRRREGLFRAVVGVGEPYRSDLGKGLSRSWNGATRPPPRSRR